MDARLEWKKSGELWHKIFREGIEFDETPISGIFEIPP
jgi:hypothetical protein